MLGLDSTLDGMLPHADMLCVLRYIPQEATPEDQGHELEQETQEEGRKVPEPPVVPASLAVLPATKATASPASKPASSRYAGSTAEVPPVLPPRLHATGTTAASTGTLPTRGWQACRDAQLLAGTTGQESPVVPALRSSLVHQTTTAPPEIFFHLAGSTDRLTGTTGAAGLRAKMAGSPCNLIPSLAISTWTYK